MRQLLVGAWCAIMLCCCGGADWLQFRGNDGRSVAGDQPLPVRWDAQGLTENIAWRTELPGRGVSGPIVVDGRVVITSASGFKQDRLHVVCYDTTDGALLWERQFWATGRTLCHPTSSVAAATPASDGESIYALFSSNDLVCLDLDGNLKWLRGLTVDYPRASNDIGLASSPLVVGDVVVVQVETYGDSFAAGIDRQSGETRWLVPRAADSNWASPTLVPTSEGTPPLVLLQSPSGVTAIEATTGQQLWTHDKTCTTISSPAVEGSLVLVPTSEGLTALERVGETGPAQPIWTENQLSPGSSSTVVDQGAVYVVNRAGALSCGDAQTGSIRWRARLTGPFWATPVLAGGHLYFINQDGLAQVVALGERGEVVAENDFGEPVFGSPAVVGGAMFVRGDRHLWKIEQR